MNHNHRKRKHKPTGGAGYGNYLVAEPAEPEQFLAHHQGHQHQSQFQPQYWAPADSSSASNTVDPLRILYIQAHEADILHGDAARPAAESLEVVEYRTVLTASGTREISVLPRIGSALIQWGDPTSAKAEDVNLTGSNEAGDGEIESVKQVAGLPLGGVDSEPAIWVDRYDARLLLSTLPPHPTSSSSKGNSNPNATLITPSLRSSLRRPSSPSGWSDMASDAEDTFFFTPDEAEDYHREKRRRLLEQSREDRLRARMQEDGVDRDAEEEDVWGDSDEEPDETQSELMTRTAAHLLSSPNPAQLEMRILANHGGDRRFAFLRGRWKNAWNLAKAKARLQKVAGEKADKKPVALSSALAGYGSGSDSGEEVDEPPEPPETVPPEPAKTEDVSVQELRRQRLKKWTEERRASQQQGSSK